MFVTTVRPRISRQGLRHSFSISTSSKYCLPACCWVVGAHSFFQDHAIPGSPTVATLLVKFQQATAAATAYRLANCREENLPARTVEAGEDEGEEEKGSASSYERERNHSGPLSILPICLMPLDAIRPYAQSTQYAPIKEELNQRHPQRAEI